MSKELEIITDYIEKIEEYEKKTGKQYLANYITKELCITIKEKLQRLEAIDNANPSEALNITKATEKYTGIDLSIIKQALLKAQEQEDKAKAFDLINTKNVDIKLLKWAYPSVEAYNVAVREQKDYWWREELTPEEFEFLGRLVGAE